MGFFVHFAHFLADVCATSVLISLVSSEPFLELFETIPACNLLLRSN